MVEFRVDKFNEYPSAINFSNGDKPIICEFAGDGIEDSMGYAILIDGNSVDVFAGQGENNWIILKKFKSVNQAKKWVAENLLEPITKQKLKKLGFEKYWSG